MKLTSMAPRQMFLFTSVPYRTPQWINAWYSRQRRRPAAVSMGDPAQKGGSKVCQNMTASMGVRRLMLGVGRGGVYLALIALPAGAGDGTQPNGPEDPTAIIFGLRRVTRELTETLKQFQAHLDREIELHDRGYRSKVGQKIPGADTELMAGPADLAVLTEERLFIARMISARGPYEPVALTDVKHILSLIEETRGLVAGGNGTMRQLLVIPAGELNSRRDIEMRAQRNDLVKARAAATEAAGRAAALLPVDAPDTLVPDDHGDAAWSLAATHLPVGKNDGTRAGGPQQQRLALDIAVPVNLEPGKRFTLVREPFRRVVLTDSGLSDPEGRHLFYQELWEQRQGATTVKRWAVAVNTATGQHTLLRRYLAREFADELDEVYRSYGHDSYRPAQLPEISDIAAATADAVRAREDLTNAAAGFQAEMKRGLADLDADLPDALRQSLFAIRGHLAHASPVREAEDKVRRAVEAADRKASGLEALTAWASGAALEGESPARDSRAQLDMLNRADNEVFQTRSEERAALTELPPEAAAPEAQFPALRKDVIVRMRGAGSSADGRTARCRQEIWVLTGREVKRTISLIDIDTRTGGQICASREVKLYPVRAGDTLESIFDENAAQR